MTPSSTRAPGAALRPSRASRESATWCAGPCRAARAHRAQVPQEAPEKLGEVVFAALCANARAAPAPKL
jgi:hypothetical protein